MARTSLLRPEKTARLIEWARHERLKLSTLGESTYDAKSFELMDEALQNIDAYSKLLADVLYGGLDGFERDYAGAEV